MLLNHFFRKSDIKSHRIAAVVLFFIFSFVMAGCGSGNGDDQKPTIIPIDDSSRLSDSTTDNETGKIASDPESDDPNPDHNKTGSLSHDTEEPSPTPSPTPSPEPEVPVIIVLDPGHGGIFSGAANGNIIEKEITLKVASHVKKYLLDNYTNIEVFLTRESDIELDSDIVTELEKRAIFAKDKNADYFVSLHFNASEDHSHSGATVYASVSKNVSDQSRALGKSILKYLTDLGLKDNGVQTRNSSDHFDTDGSPLDYYAVLRHNAAREIPAVIVEHCFMDNGSDLAFMDNDEKLKALAEADALGIAEYMKLEKTVK